MIAVLIESPLAGDVERNMAYARACMRDSLRRGEAPFLSYLLYPQVLNDDDPAERMLGIEAGLLIGSRMDLTAVYEDLGVSPGMAIGIERARMQGRAVVYRVLGSW